jgi:hypothetical protein
MTTTTTPQDVPIPGGAIDVADWYDLDTEPARYFTGMRRVIARDNRDHDTQVLVDGTQWADGRIERIISVDDDNLTVGQARQIAAALNEAAEEVDSVVETMTHGGHKSSA